MTPNVDSNANNILELTVTANSPPVKHDILKQDPFFVIVHPEDIRKLDVVCGDYVHLRSYPPFSLRRVEICARAICASEPDNLKPGEVVISQDISAMLLDTVYTPEIILSRTLKLGVAVTDVKKQPSTDYIVIMRKDKMRQLGLNFLDYVNLMNPCVGAADGRPLQILAQAASIEDLRERDFLNMRFENLDDEHIAIDQTCREALRLEKCETVIVSNAHRKYGFREYILTKLDYQKAVARVHENSPYMEHKTPVACLCEELVTSISAVYGDRIEVEYMGEKTVVKCAKLTQRMEELHDSFLDPESQEYRTKLGIECKDKVDVRCCDSAPTSEVECKDKVDVRCCDSAPTSEVECKDKVDVRCCDSAPTSEVECKDKVDRSNKAVFRIIEDDACPKLDHIAKGKRQSRDMVHPIFMDKIARKSINVNNLYPVKIRKNFRWQFWKAVNRFGSLTSLIAASVFLTFALTPTPSALTPTPSALTPTPSPHIFGISIYWVLFMGIVLWGIWSALTASTYRVSGGNG